MFLQRSDLSGTRQGPRSAKQAPRQTIRPARHSKHTEEAAQARHTFGMLHSIALFLPDHIRIYRYDIWQKPHRYLLHDTAGYSGRVIWFAMKGIFRPEDALHHYLVKSDR